MQHVQAPASQTGPGLTSVTSDLKPSIGKCVSLRGKEARHQEDLFGTETQISLGGGQTRWLRWVCKPQRPAEPSIWGVNMRRPRLPDVNSSTVTELLCNSNYEWVNEFGTRSREENRPCPDGRVCASVPRFPSPCRIFHHCKQLIEVKMSGFEHRAVSIFQVWHMWF